MIYLSWDGVSLACAGFEVVLSLGMTLTSSLSPRCWDYRCVLISHQAKNGLQNADLLSFEFCILWLEIHKYSFPSHSCRKFYCLLWQDLTAWGRPSKQPAKITHCTFSILKNHWAMWINNVWIFSIIAKLMCKNLSLSPCQNQSASQRTQSKIK